MVSGKRSGDRLREWACALSSPGVTYSGSAFKTGAIRLAGARIKSDYRTRAPHTTVTLGWRVVVDRVGIETSHETAPCPAKRQRPWSTPTRLLGTNTERGVPRVNHARFGLLKRQRDGGTARRLDVVRGGRVRLDRRCARSRWNAQVAGCPVPLLSEQCAGRSYGTPADHAASQPYMRTAYPLKVRRARRVAV
jgi:hypothetical protein